MKTEFGPTKYRLARRLKLSGPDEYYEYILQGWFEFTEYDEYSPTPEGDHQGGEWRDLETVDIK